MDTLLFYSAVMRKYSGCPGNRIKYISTLGSRRGNTNRTCIPSFGTSPPCSVLKPTAPHSSYPPALLVPAGIYIKPHESSRIGTFPDCSWPIRSMVHTHRSSIDNPSLNKEHRASKTPSPASSSYCTPGHRRQALALLDPNTPVKPPSSCTTITKILNTPRTKSPLNQMREKHNQDIPSTVLSCSPPPLSTKQSQTPGTKSLSNEKGFHIRNFPSPVSISSPPALEKLQHDLTNRRHLFDESEGEEHYARRRANVSRMREYREKARRLAKRIGRTRREVEEGIQRLGGSTEKIQEKVAGFDTSNS